MTSPASPSPTTHMLQTALVGNPNCGKTSLFNQLTGSRQKVANYAGVTVERKEGFFSTPQGRPIRVLDLPGAYSLASTSPDEDVTRDVCLGQHRTEKRPELLISVISATNLRLHLRFLLELRQLEVPVIVALNMMDEAKRNGMTIDIAGLEQELGMPIVPVISLNRQGVQPLLEALDRPLPPPPKALSPDADLHAEVRRLLQAYVTNRSAGHARLVDRLDRWFLHPVWGPVILLVVLFVMFQTVFAWAQPLMDALESGITMLGEFILRPLPDGVLRSLLADGVIAGAGTVIVFLPQILILFLWILALEESGYLPRAAFLLDRVMALAGLSGRSFIPLLSSFACAIPGIMAARTIQNPRDRLVTILIAPLMTCSARLPVYTLLIGAFIPHKTVLGIFGIQGLVLFGLYALAIVSGIIAARIMTRGVKSEEHPLLLELPPYRRPNLKSLALGLWQRAVMFLSRVGTIIVSLNVLLWGLSSFPLPPAGATGAAIDYSLAGRIGHLMLPIFAPIGFNWQICVSLIPGLAAREVAVSALATVYALGVSEDAASAKLLPLLSSQWSIATALSLLAWYVYAPQCISTLAVMRRETQSMKVVLGATAYLFGLAYAAAFIVYHVARAVTGDA
ncbi:ferrous iron transporter B [Gluconobacter cerinus]|uniref:ferrous iron transporter B n=2 Tax=Acetobacteraceae TaxID=433 RepID=UPI000A3602C5|nr:ferrous iron transporter B [Gluconobacter cerinus]MBS1025771.1 ferrous iron transporter B [Gluconobacter cerinus]MBS1037949.1 ferrous iron transporter B [Gluconobacter cerinus]MBS1045377.1 ferrous iron transporter B [Gluconobacter cerinus]OUJ06979.1 iron transporter FeoB [Gluconobacter sp. DsW_058]